MRTPISIERRRGEAEIAPPPPSTTAPGEPSRAPRPRPRSAPGSTRAALIVFACTQRDPTVVRVTYAPDGTLEIQLAGGLEGTAEEGCVRAALSGVRAPASETGGTVLHLIHRS